MDKKFLLLSITLVIFILGAGAGLWWYYAEQSGSSPYHSPQQDQNNKEKEQEDSSKPSSEIDGEIPLQAEYENKIVYTTTRDVNVEKLREDCRERKGDFKECGNVCGPEANSCITTCAYTCRLEKEEGDNTSFGEWRDYTDKELGFRIELPPGLKAESENDRVNFILRGPTQQEGTELSDGIKFSVYKATHTRQSLGEYAEQQVEEAEEVEIKEPLQEVEVDDITGYRYKEVSDLGEFTILLLPLNKGEALRISYTAPDPGARGYEKKAQEMVESLELLD